MIESSVDTGTSNFSKFGIIDKVFNCISVNPVNVGSGLKTSSSRLGINLAILRVMYLDDKNGEFLFKT